MKATASLCRVAFATLLALFATKAESAIVFQLTFQDVVSHTNSNWDDPTYGAEVRAKLQSVLNGFGQAFVRTAVINLDIRSSQTTAFYAASTAATWKMEPSNRYYDSNTFVKIQTGVDVNGSALDGTIIYSFNLVGLNYPDYNLDGIRNILDLGFTIDGLTRHELLHVLGMSSAIYPGVTQADRFTKHDTFLKDSAGVLFVRANGTLNTAANVNDPNAYFDSIGSNYPIASAGDYGHLLGIMYPYRSSFNEADMEYLRTLGYQMVPTPEPTSGVLLAVAGVVFWSGRRRRLAPFFYSSCVSRYFFLYLIYILGFPTDPYESRVMTIQENSSNASSFSFTLIRQALFTVAIRL